MDEQTKKQLRENSKNISDLVKAVDGLKDSVKSGNETTLGGVAKGTVDGIKDAFKGNQTIQFLTDPAAGIGKAFSSLTDPLKRLVPNFKEIGEKLTGTFGGGNNKEVVKRLAKIEKLLEKQNKNVMAQLTDVFDPDEYAGAVEEGLGQAQVSATLRESKFLQDTLNPLTKLTVLTKLGPELLKGALLKPVEMLAEKTGALRLFFGEGLKADRKVLSLENDAIVSFHEGYYQLFIKSFSGIRQDTTDTAIRLKGIGQVFQTGMQSISNRIADGVKKIGPQTAEAIGNELMTSDQAKAERERDAENERQERSEQLLLALNELKEAQGIEIVETGKKTGGLIGWFKKNVLGIGAGAIAAKATGLGAGIAGFFKAVGSGFMFMGSNLPLFAKGALAVGLMGASLLPFALSLDQLNKALEGFTFKKILVFTGMLAIVGSALALFAATISTGIGAAVLFTAIGALAAVGAALIPFGYGIKMAGPGLESAAVLMTSIAMIPWQNFFLAGPAIAALSAALVGLSASGFLNRFLGGGAKDTLEEISNLGKEVNSIVAAAGAMDAFKTSLENLSSVNLKDTGITDFLENMVSSTKTLTSNSKMKKAVNNIGNFLGKITEHLNYNEGRVELINSMNELIARASGDTNFTLDKLNNAGSMMEAYSVGLLDGQRANTGGGDAAPVIINQGGSTSTNVTNNVSTDWHLNEKTKDLLFNT